MVSQYQSITSHKNSEKKDTPSISSHPKSKNAAKKMKRIPFLLTFHTLHAKYAHYFLNGRVIKPRMIETGLRLFANLCDGIITPSEKMKNELIRYGVKKSIHVIPNFVE